MTNSRDPLDINDDSRSIVIAGEPVPLSQDGINGDEPLDDISEERIVLGTRIISKGAKVIFNSKDYGVFKNETDQNSQRVQRGGA